MEEIIGFVKLDKMKIEDIRRVYDYILRSLDIQFVIEDVGQRPTMQYTGILMVRCCFCNAKNVDEAYIRIDTVRQVFMCRHCKTCGDLIEFVRKAKPILTKQRAMEYIMDRYRLNLDCII